MLDKQDFYHGAVIVNIMHKEMLRSFSKERGAYLVNDHGCLLVKYTTKPRSPWRFTLTESEVQLMQKLSKKRSVAVLALVCGGDGICGLEWSEVEELIPSTGGWLSCKRKHNTTYAVHGQTGVMDRKVPLNRIQEMF